jgi:hypothetical protein
MSLSTHQHPVVLLAEIHAAMGQYGQAADELLKGSRTDVPPATVETAARLLRAAPTPAPRQGIPDLGPLSFVFAYVGAPERALEPYERDADAQMSVPIIDVELWGPRFRPVRNTERFKALVRKWGLVDYWRAKGWPEFCHPVGTNDFACK